MFTTLNNVIIVHIGHVPFLRVFPLRDIGLGRSRALLWALGGGRCLTRRFLPHIVKAVWDGEGVLFIVHHNIVNRGVTFEQYFYCRGVNSTYFECRLTRSSISSPVSLVILSDMAGRTVSVTNMASFCMDSVIGTFSSRDSASVNSSIMFRKMSQKQSMKISKAFGV